MKEVLNQIDIQPAAEAQQERLKFTTGSYELDKLLGGGIETHSLTEIYGDSGTGKTDLCHTLAITCQLPVNMGGGEGRCIYIDTEGTYRHERLSEVTKCYGLHASINFDNIGYAKAVSADHLHKLRMDADKLMNTRRFVLLIIDSATAIYRTNVYLRSIFQLVNKFEVAVVLTNRASMFTTEPNKNYIKRLYQRKGIGETRICKIIDSSCLPEAEAIFANLPNDIED